MKQIPLTQGKVALVDDDMYEFLNQWKWCTYRGGSTYYAGRGAKGTTVWMHRVIMATVQGRQVDHINHNGLDNRQVNLRVCSRAENHHNQLPGRGGTSKYKGVSRHREKWQAQVRHNNKGMYIGLYALEEDAAIAYNKKAEELFGEFACLNVIERKKI